jgi:predicted ATPase/DNA-binding XRE family transcriptional regulator
VTHDRTSFGAFLRRHRQAAGLTQEALAERAGVSVEAIGTLERGARRAPYASTVELLAAALDLTPAQRDELLRSSGRRRRPPGPAAEPAPGLLPIPPTPLIGRDADRTQACAVLSRPEVRLLTLTGTPGVGKSRLALAVADRLAARSPDGTFFVGLTSLADPALVGTAIRVVLGLRAAEGQRTEDALAAGIGERHVLVLLDNFEHLLPAAPLLSELLARCPCLHLLVTSRTRLGLRGEHHLLVRPLPVPDERDSSPAGLRRNASAALFVQAARAVSPAFALTTGNAGAVGEICRRLEGLPLALELAAAWTRLLAPGALRDRLGDRLEMLVGGAPDLPAHQRTMRAALQWSHDLLSEGEQAMFRRLSVFAGGAWLDAVAEVCQAAGALPGGVLDIAAGLLDKNLAEAAPGDDLRLVVPETMREYGRELLVAAGEADATARAHAAACLDLLRVADPALRGPDQACWLARLELEHDNLRAALRWALESGDHETGLELGGRLNQFWTRRCHWQEALAWQEQLLGSTVGVVSQARSRILRSAGVMRSRHGDYTGAATCYEQSLRVSRDLGDRWGAAQALNSLGVLAAARHDFREARRLHGEANELLRTLDDLHAVVVATTNVGLCDLELGDLAAAAGLLEEAVRLARETGDIAGLVPGLRHLGTVAQRRGEDERARDVLEESLRHARDLGDEHGYALTLIALGRVERDRGRDGACRHHAEALGVMLRLGEPRGMAICLEDLAGTAAVRGDPPLAARLYGAAAAARERLGIMPGPDRHQAARAEVRGTMGDAAFESAWSAGRLLTLEAAARDALDWAGRTGPAA